MYRYRYTAIPITLSYVPNMTKTFYTYFIYLKPFAYSGQFLSPSTALASFSQSQYSIGPMIGNTYFG